MTTPLGATLGFPHVIRSQFKIFCCCQMSQLFTHRQTHALTPLLFHSPTLTSPNAVRSTRNENKRLEFRVWHQIEFSSHRPPTPSVSASCFFVFVFPHHSLTDLFSPSNQKQKEKKNPGRRTLIFFPSKTNLMEKKKLKFFFFFYVFIYIFVFQIQGTMSICIPIRLHSQVQCANMVSHEPDCLLIQLYISPVCTLNTVIKRCVCFG